MVTVVLVDSSVGAIVRSFEIYASVEEASRALNRQPDYAEDGTSSWSDAGIDDIERLLLHNDAPDQEGFNTISAWHAEYAGREYFWSLYFDEKEYV